MKRSQQITIIVIFLSIIYTVPIVQSVYEFTHNEGHRIQIMDLVEDLFVTPMKKASADAAMIDSLADEAAQIGKEIQATKITADNTTHPWDPQIALDLCDDAATKIFVLKKSIIDYNRHLEGDLNKFAAEDTLKPYYVSLVRLEQSLEDVRGALQSSANPAEVAVRDAVLQNDVGAVRKNFGGEKSIIDYPAMTLTALRRCMVGADYLRPYEKDVEQSSIFASAIRPWMLMAYYRAYGDLGSKGIMGEHGWFFYRPDVDYLVKPSVFDSRSRDVDPNDVPITDNIIGNIVSFKNRLTGNGIDLLLVIMPTKPSIYPELVNKRMKPESAGTFSHSLAIMEQLNKAGIETINLFGAFAAERNRDAAEGDSLYLRTDTHFKRRAVLLTAHAIANRVKQYPWYINGTTEYSIDSVVIFRSGDIGEMTNLGSFHLGKYEFSFPPESTLCYQVYRIARDEKGTVTDRTLYKDDYARSQILVLGDSFSRIYQTDLPKAAGWIAHLARDLSQPVASVVSDGGASTLVRQVLARKPQLLKNKKLVIWEIVERDFRFGAEGWKDVVIH